MLISSKDVSIHALLAECDYPTTTPGILIPVVSIHALLAECDGACPGNGWQVRCFNPRTPCGVRQSSTGEQPGQRKVSIHALLAECDTNYTALKPLKERFQSTHSLRSATFREYRGKLDAEVSIHALLAECDTYGMKWSVGLHGFNPRTPCGVRPVAYTTVTAAGGFNPRTPCGVRRLVETGHTFTDMFQSTHSLRSATGRT